MGAIAAFGVGGCGDRQFFGWGYIILSVLREIFAIVPSSVMFFSDDIPKLNFCGLWLTLVFHFDIIGNIEMKKIECDFDQTKKYGSKT